jgi:N6-L-threonylcarbamoyladenine synthase
MKSSVILGIESSCDETSAAVLLKDQQGIKILSNIVASSALLQSKYGGIIPEQAAREQVKAIIPVIREALETASCKPADIDAIAVTEGPGLIGSLLVGVETAKVLSLIWQKPLIPVNHLIGHFYANWIDQSSVVGGQLLDESQSAWPAGRQVISLSETDKQKTDKPLSGNRELKTENWAPPSFPCLGLLVSGGHTDLVIFESHGKHKYLGGTRDDAAGECFDKCARILGLPYPGGPQISKLAQSGNPRKYNLPRPMFDSDDYDFSFSGLKTAVSNLINQQPTTNNQSPDLCASIEQAIVDCLIDKTVRAAQNFNIEQIIVSGGVAANTRLRDELKRVCKLKIVGQRPISPWLKNCKLFFPPPILCTDNAAMIASAAFFQKSIKDPEGLQANTNLSLVY